jgi:uncharacterized membrane protein
VNRILRRPGTLVWAVLMLATVLSWTLGTRHDVFGAGTRVATIGVLVLAFVKVRLIGTHFMELHQAPRALARAFDGWVVVVCVMIIGLYLFPPV